MEMLYPIGIQNFEDIREGKFVYVDKTRLVFNLSTVGKCYFLSRPRRFGKSLLVSTMESYFLGKKELFEGLEISRLEKDWTEYPVLHLDFTGSKYLQKDDLDVTLDQHLSNWEKRYEILPRYDNLTARFKDIIDATNEKTGKQVVILIDEYDKPIVDNLGNDELADYYKSVLQGFYSVMKAKDGFIRFGFITGVSKIGKMSVFSGLNNLKDISMMPEYADICGITEHELVAYFDAGIQEMADANGLSKQECYDKLRKMYDGYHFCQNAIGTYNPFSLLNALMDKDFNAYWFETGTPTLLVNVAKRTEFDITTLSDNVVVSASALNGNLDIVNNPVPLFYQTGYLTIKDYDKEYREYRLGFPNEEVKDGFLNFIYSYYVPVNPANGNTRISTLSRSLKAGKPEEFMKALSSLFADTTYQIQGDAEKDFQYAMYIILELLGEHVEAERHTSDGRIDLLIRTKEFIYIIEIKTDKSAAEALAQIDDKGYARPFADDPRKIFRIGVNFSTAKRCIDDWKIA